MKQIYLVDYYHPKKMYILDRETLTFRGPYRRDIPRGDRKDAGFAGFVKCRRGFFSRRHKHFVAVFAEEGRHLFLIDGQMYDMSDKSTTVKLEEMKHFFSVRRLFTVLKDGNVIFSCSYRYADSWAQGWPGCDDLLIWIANVAAGGKGFLWREVHPRYLWDEE